MEKMQLDGSAKKKKLKQEKSARSKNHSVKKIHHEKSNKSKTWKKSA